LKIRTLGRGIALISVAAVVFAACSSSGGSAAPSAAASAAATTAASAAATTAASAAASSGASSAAGKPLKIGFLPKDIVNTYFAAAKLGVDKAAKVDGSTVIQVGPNEAKADLQVPFIADLTTQKVDAILISADGKDEVAPNLKAAMAAGIKVVGFDSSPAVGAYNVFVNQTDFSLIGGAMAQWACDLAPNCEGEIAILSATATATNQNSWIADMNTALKDPKFAKLKLVDTVYGDDNATTSTTQANALLTKHPNLKVIVAPTTVGILAAAQVVKQAGSAVKVTGLGLPNDNKIYVKKGITEAVVLWKTADLGYLAVQAAVRLYRLTTAFPPSLVSYASHLDQEIAESEDGAEGPRAFREKRKADRPELRDVNSPCVTGARRYPHPLTWDGQAGRINLGFGLR
jgi:rhamnose transport system substrate-binding protein